MFNDMNTALSRDALLAYPYFTKPFEIHADDASHTQLGAVINQENQPIAFKKVYEYTNHKK